MNNSGSNVFIKWDWTRIFVLIIYATLDYYIQEKFKQNSILTSFIDRQDIFVFCSVNDLTHI